MSNDRRLTREEQRTVESALEIIDGWIRAHVNDQQRPYGYADVAAAHKELCDGAWTMFGKEA